MRSFLGLALLLPAAATAAAAAAGTTAGQRRIGWWWDAPASADDPTVDALLKWTANHTDIVSSVLMRCGPTTLNGSVSGALLPSCAKAIPALKALGVESELWLGETDSSESALKLFRDTEATVKALAELGRAHPGITGFNFDLCACISLYSTASASDRFLCCLSHPAEFTKRVPRHTPHTAATT
jgi:hypothetical protein|eukprot:COSAG06_NODE_1476_length_9335_cov_181.006063_6_plen_184_part_00